jgi:serine/threonine-protein kinase
VSGETLIQATLKLSNAGFNPVQASENSTSVAAGGVIGTNPPANSVEPYGSTVTVEVSLGPNTVNVPYVVGDRQATATGALTRHGLSPSVVNVPTTIRNDNGRVISTNPAGGTSVNKGSTVQVDIGVYSAPTTTSTSSTTSTTLPGSTTTTTTTTTTGPAKGHSSPPGKGPGGSS